ncbi:MAG: metalloregulator ArsR/SmtB family transcription factor [Candidatus Thermoplasmatota archaeon]
MKEERPDDERIHEMHAELCKMLSHPTRLKILEQLKQENKTVKEIVESTDASQPTVSQHLGQLKKQGLVRAEREGTSMEYHIEHPKILDACDIIREVLFERLSENQELLGRGENYD